MALIETLVPVLLGAIITLIVTYFAFVPKLESRLKDLEHGLKDLECKIQFLDPFKEKLTEYGAKRVDEVFESGGNK